MKSKKILILGGDSKIGNALYLDLKNSFSISKSTRKNFLGVDEFYLDLSNELSFSILPKEKFDFVFICISITSINYCENNILETNRINVNHTIELIKYYHNQGSFIIYFSSNLVFDGTKKKMRHNSKVNPQINYGRQKVEVEKFLLKIPKSAIIRMTKIIDKNFNLFENWINNLLNNNTIIAFNDMQMSPVWMFDLLFFLC